MTWIELQPERRSYPEAYQDARARLASNTYEIDPEVINFIGGLPSVLRNLLLQYVRSEAYVRKASQLTEHKPRGFVIGDIMGDVFENIAYFYIARYMKPHVVLFSPQETDQLYASGGFRSFRAPDCIAFTAQGDSFQIIGSVESTIQKKLRGRKKQQLERNESAQVVRTLIEYNQPAYIHYVRNYIEHHQLQIQPPIRFDLDPRSFTPVYATPSDVDWSIEKTKPQYIVPVPISRTELHAFAQIAQAAFRRKRLSTHS